MRGYGEVEDLVRARVCGVCVLREEICQAQAPGRCLLFELFPLVVQAILATEGGDLAGYQRSIRENVCPVCTEAALDLSCELRERLRCALDRYLGEVAEVIRQAAESGGRLAPGVDPAQAA